MRAKKNLYLNYLRDNSLNKINKSKTYKKRKSLSSQNNNKKPIIKNHSFINYNKNKEKLSFENFVYHIKNYDYNEKEKWDNPARKYAINIDKDLNRIKLTELNQINYANPLLILNKEYIQEDYNPNLFESELISIEDRIKIVKNNNNKKNKVNLYSIFDNINNFIEKIMEKRENLEVHKKIINYYLQYYCQNNFELMNPSMNKIRELTNIVDVYYDRIHSKKKKSLDLKSGLIDKTMEIILKKKKFDNLTKIYLILRNKTLACYKDIKMLKLKKMNFNYIKYYEENSRLINEVESLEKNFLKEFAQKKQIKIKFVEEMKRKLIRKKEKLNIIYKYEMKNIFEAKKSNIKDLFFLFNIEHNIQGDNETQNGICLFINEMIKVYKLTSKKIILEIVQHFQNKENRDLNSIIIFNINKPKLGEIKNIYIEEKNLIPFFSQIFMKLRNHLDIFIFYYDSISSEKSDLDKYKNFKEEMRTRKNDFYEILDKHVSKLIILLNIIIGKDEQDPYISKKKLLILLNMICLFEKLLKIKLNVKYNKYINSALKTFLIKLIKFENKKVIDKVMTLLSKEKFDKKIIDSSFFNIDLINRRIPLYLSKFISFFNESEIKGSLTSKLITKNNIDNIFNYIISYYDKPNNKKNKTNINFNEVLNLYSKEEMDKFKKEIENENDIIIFNKPLNYNTLFYTDSSCCIIKLIEEQIINLIMFESMTYEIFSELFDTIDMYIFISLKMFLKDNTYLTKLSKNINLKDIQRDMGNLEYWSDIVLYQKKNFELKKFYFSTEQKICFFFGEGKEFLTEEERQSFINNLISNLDKPYEIEIKPAEEDNKFSFANITENFNIFSTKRNNSNKNIRVQFDLNKNNKISNEEEKNITSEKDKEDKNIDKNNKDREENKEDIDSPVKNQINESNKIKNSFSSSNSKSKIDGLKFFNFFLPSYESNIKEVPIEELINDIKLKISTVQIKETILYISSILTFKKILKRLVLFSTKIELELQRYQILSKINIYEKLIEQIRNLFYEVISSEILDFSNISYLIVNFNWSPDPVKGSSQLFEASDWVKKLEKLFEIIVSEIHNKFNELFGEKMLAQFFINLIRFIVESLQENFSKIKKCNDIGRSIMLKDIKLLKEGIDNILAKYNYSKKIKINFLFDILIQYANAWYYDNEELTKFVYNYNIRYKYFESLMNSSPKINELSYEIKNELINKVKDNYLSQFKKFIAKSKEDN